MTDAGGTRRGERTRTRLLDAAESLFAEKGFHGVTVRAIARQADSDPALVAYYFGGKRELFDAVLLRRAEELNEIRLAELAACEANAGPEGPTLEAIIHAFTHPLLDRSANGGPGWKSYFALVGQVTNSPEWGVAIMSKYFDPIVRRFLDAVRRALPDAHDDRALLEAALAWIPGAHVPVTQAAGVPLHLQGTSAFCGVCKKGRGGGKEGHKEDTRNVG